jgi:two-component system chemotaxis response regulator CheY
MRILIAEDDLTSRLLLKKMLEPFGTCDVAVNGKEATQAFRMALDNGEGYKLVCMDIMMPEMDGQAALKAIRQQEEDSGCLPSRAAKIIMTTALGDIENVSSAFRELCDGYLVKPIARTKLIALLKDLEVIVLQPEHLTS